VLRRREDLQRPRAWAVAQRRCSKYATAILEDGTRFLVDRRAAARLPSHFALTMRGLGPSRHLDLDLGGEQWGALFD
jgi:hypothetical protein